MDPLLGRVVHKSQLHYFGRLSESTALPYATFFSVVLKDTSKRPEDEGVQVTMWNRMAQLSLRWAYTWAQTHAVHSAWAGEETMRDNTQ